MWCQQGTPGEAVESVGHSAEQVATYLDEDALAQR
jgi:hypothetical protein